MMTLLQKTYKMPFSNMVQVPPNLIRELDGMPSPPIVPSFCLSGIA